MKFINKLERKFGRYAIHDFIKYVIVLYGLGAFIGTVNPSFYHTFLSLDIGKVMEGQVWRLFTFLIEPKAITGLFDMFFLAIELYIYYMIGQSLENAWGAFRFNLYFISGVLFNITAAIIIYPFIGGSYPMGLAYLNRAMFFAFATLYPNMQFLLMFVIPVKVKYLAYLYAAIIVKDVVGNVFSGNIAYAVGILVSLANFLLFFFNTRNYRKMSPKEYKRRAAYKKEVNRSKTITRHKCAVCGRTEEDDENLEFRFCSKCDGNYEYCMEHLFTHEHVHKH